MKYPDAPRISPTGIMEPLSVPTPPVPPRVRECVVGCPTRAITLCGDGRFVSTWGVCLCSDCAKACPWETSFPAESIASPRHPGKTS
jgi:Fe-S-cluster-containing hydrogenase component 2